MPKTFGKCPRCGQYDWLGRHRCPLCWTVTIEDEDSRSVYAIDAKTAAETAAGMWDEGGTLAYGGNEVLVTVERDGDCQVFTVRGTMTAHYHGFPVDEDLPVERYQEGDRVRIWDQHSTLHGQVGTVVQADEQRYQYAVVLVDGAELSQWWPCAKLRRVEVSDDEADGTGAR